MKARTIFQIILVCLIGDAHRSHAACRTTAASAEIKVVVPFAIPVGIPVAPLAPFFYSYRETQVQERGTRIEERASPSILAPRDSLLTQHCSVCHSGSAPKAGLTFESVAALALADRLRAVRAVASGRMPQGESLSVDEIRALLNELTQTNHGDTEAQRGSQSANPARE